MGRETNRKVHNKLIVLLFAGMLLCLTACGNPTQPATTDEPAPPVFTFDWKTDVFQVTDKVSEAKQYQMKTYHEWEHAKSDKENTRLFYSYSTDGKSFLTGVEERAYTENMSEVLSTEFYKESMNPATGEITKTSITDEEFHKLFDDPKEAGLLPPLELYTAENSQASIWGVTYSDDGELIYAVYNQEENSQEIKRYDEEAGTERVLGEVPYRQFEQLLAMKGQNVYYASMNDLVCWNVETGVREKFFSTTDNGFKSGMTKQLLIGKEGSLYLRCISKTEDCVMELTMEEVDKGEPIRIVDISGDGTYRNIVGEAAAVFSRKNPGSFVELTKKETDEEAYRTRIMAEVTAGKGADILLVNREDMKLLYEKGWAADLRNYLSEETLGQLLPGVIELGTVEKTLVGLAPEVSVRALFTKRSIWDKDSWTVTDIIGLLGNNSNQKQYMVDYIEEELSALMTLYNYALRDLEDSLFVDWEKGESTFDREEFITLLELTKGCEGPKLTVNEKAELLQAGECLAVSTPFMVRFANFVSMADMLGEDFYPIGFPSETGSANYLQEGKIVMINKNTKSPEKVSAFLEYLVSEKAQETTVKYSVRRNSVTEDMVRKSSDREDEWAFYDGKSDGYTVIESKQDVKAYVKQYNEFLENCKPIPKIPETLEYIIWDELILFFDGARSAKETAKVIDNRVQLYLDEQK